MKILTIICEFNPLHNGHKYLIGRAAASGYDAVVCVMSGCFTQRGEMCRNDKYARARHAVLCGADAVIELPAPFAVAPAEIFAQGAVKTMCSIPGAEAITFGHETGCAEQFFEAAHLLNDESEKFRAALESGLDGGESYIRSYCAAFEKCGGDVDFLSHPNNILGVEYAKAILKSGKDIKILPVKRIGADYGEEKLCGNYSSARAIRANSQDIAIADNMPPFSYRDFTAAKDNRERFERLAADWAFLCEKDNLKRVYGCTEGLENRIKKSLGADYGGIIEACSGKRYSKSRIARILAANLLGLYADDAAEFLKAELPLRVLAVKKERADELLSALAPVNCENLALEGEAKKCFSLTSRAYSLWRHLNYPPACDNPNEKMLLV